MKKQEYEYLNFEDWFHEPEGFSFRSERFFSFFGEDKQTKDHAKLWLRAAFDSARLEHGNERENGE